MMKSLLNFSDQITLVLGDVLTFWQAKYFKIFYENNKLLFTDKHELSIVVNNFDLAPLFLCK